MKTIALAFLITFSFSLLGYSQWEMRYPTLPEDKITDITFTSEATGFFVNEAGAIYRTVDGGANWKEVFYDEHSGFTNIQFVDDQLGYAYGYQRSNFTYTQNGGNTWYQDDLNVSRATSVIGFSGSEFLKVDELGIWKTTSVFGSWDSVLTFPTKTVDGGDLIYDTPVTTPRETWKINDTTLIVWMSNNFINDFEQRENSDSLNYFLYSEDRGNTWDSVWTNVIGKFEAVGMIDSASGYIYTEDNKFFKKSNNSSNWVNVEVPPTEFGLYNIKVISPERVYLYGNSEVLTTKNSGESWQLLEKPKSGSYIISKHNLTALYDLVLKVDDEGESWHEGRNFQKVYGNKIHFINENIGWSYGGGEITKTEDGGFTWEADNNLPVYPKLIKFTNENEGWILTNTSLYKTVDRGSNWDERQIFETNRTKYNEHLLFDEKFAVIYGNTDCWENVCSNLFVSIDKGETWTRKEIPVYFRSLSITGNSIFAVDNDKRLWKSNDSGDTWKVVYDFSHENLYVKPMVRAKYNMVWLNIGSKSLAYSKDSGETWKTTSAELDEDMELIGPFFKGNYYLYLPNPGYVTRINSELGVYDKRDQLLHTSPVISDIDFVLDENDIPHIWIKGRHTNTVFYRKGPLKVYVSNESEEVVRPLTTTLHQNYPNPFNPSTTFSFDLNNSGHVKLSVFDITGREVAIIQNNRLAAGNHSIHFDASQLASGTYIYRLETEDKVLSKSFTLIK